jgi:Leucine-rich repeat (LRR) protein
MRKLFSLFIIFLLSVLSLQAQDEATIKSLKKRLKADQLILDEGNGDGVFKARIKSTKKWGMYQWTYSGTNYKVLVPARYDSLGFFRFNGTFAIAKKGNKYGTVSSPWSGESTYSKPVIPFVYESIKVVDHKGTWLAAKKDGKWSFIDKESGKAYIPWIFESAEELPAPNPYMKKHPMDSLPKAVQEFMKEPEKHTELKLNGFGLTFLPNEIAQCKNLKILYLERNFLAEVPEELAQLKQLEELYLGSNPGIDHVGPVVSQLTNLKVLYVGKRALYGPTTYTTESITFDQSLAQLTSLKELGILNYFSSDIPEFIYELPHLKVLDLEGIYLNVDFPKLDLSRMKCKASLQKLKIKFISDFSTFNDNLADFPQISYLYIETGGSEAAPEALIMHPKVRYLRIVGYKKNTDNNRYTGDDVIYFNRTKDDLPTTEERKEALSKWEAYMREVKALEKE